MPEDHTVSGRCGSLAIDAGALERLQEALAPGRPMRIAYFPGVRDFHTSVQHWAVGEHDPGYASIAYGTQFCDLAEALNAETLVFDHGTETASESPVPRQRIVPVPHVGATPTAVGGRLDHFRRMSRVREAINAFGADIAVIGERTDWFAVQGLSALVIRSIHCNLWHIDRDEPSVTDRMRLVDQIARSGRLTDAAVSVSEAGARQLGWLHKGRLPAFVCVPQSQSLSLPEVSPFGETPRIFFLGRTVAAKGIFDLLTAAMKIKQDHPALELIMAGDGNTYRRLVDEIELRGIGDWVKAPGWLSSEAIAEEVRKASLVVLPSRSGHREGRPRALAEAHMLGRPSVTSSLCEPVDDRCTLVFEAENRDALETALRRALFEPETRDRLRRAARENRSVYTDRRLSWGTRLFEAMCAAAGVAAP